MAKQLEIAGTERPKIKAIEEAADAYVSVRDKRMALTEKEVVAKTNLIQVVTENRAKLTPNGEGALCYRFDDLIVILKPGHDNVKVKSAHDDEEDDED
jgi:hypothetical protein